MLWLRPKDMTGIAYATTVEVFDPTHAVGEICTAAINALATREPLSPLKAADLRRASSRRRAPALVASPFVACGAFDGGRGPMH